MKDRKNEAFEQLCSIMAENKFDGCVGKDYFVSLCEECGLSPDYAEFRLHESLGMCSAEIIEAFRGR